MKKRVALISSVLVLYITLFEFLAVFFPTLYSNNSQLEEKDSRILLSQEQNITYESIISFETPDPGKAVDISSDGQYCVGVSGGKVYLFQKKIPTDEDGEVPDTDGMFIGLIILIVSLIISGCVLAGLIFLYFRRKEEFDEERYRRIYDDEKVSLNECPKCGWILSAKAKICPKCGAIPKKLEKETIK